MSADPQAKRVYQMENDYLLGHCAGIVPMDQMRKMTRKVLKEFSITVPELKARRLRGYCAYVVNDGMPIHFDLKVGCNYITLAHELAHYILFTYMPNAPLHGAAFMGLYAYLAEQMGVMPEEGMRAMARASGIKIAKGVANRVRRLATARS